MGLERRFQDAWGDAPTMMCVGETCVALFVSAGPDLGRCRPARDWLLASHRFPRRPGQFRGGSAALQRPRNRVPNRQTMGSRSRFTSPTRMATGSRSRLTTLRRRPRLAWLGRPSTQALPREPSLVRRRAFLLRHSTGSARRNSPEKVALRPRLRDAKPAPTTRWLREVLRLRINPVAAP